MPEEPIKIGDRCRVKHSVWAKASGMFNKVGTVTKINPVSYVLWFDDIATPGDICVLNHRLEKLDD